MNIADFNIPLIFYVSFILLIWFESDIIETLAKLTNTFKLFKIYEFHKYKVEENVMANYPTFLYEKYRGYLTKLISCPICLCFWSTIFSLIIFLFIFGLPFAYFILLFPINYISSLSIYLVVRKLL